MPKPELIDILLEEYKTLRGETLSAMNNQHDMLKVGIGAVSVLITAGFGLSGNGTIIPIIIFMFFVPVTCYLSLIVWIGEVERMMKAGKYISMIEKRISKEYPDQEYVLNWENWLRTKSNGKKGPQTLLNYASIIFLFFTVAAISIVIGSFKTRSDKVYDVYFIPFLTIGLILFLLVVLSIYVLGMKLKKS